MTQLGKNFLDKTPKARFIKERIDKLDFIKLRTWEIFDRHC